jgi:hypothetical protein
LRNGKHHNVKAQRAYDKYVTQFGGSMISGLAELVPGDNEWELEAVEQFWIDRFKPFSVYVLNVSRIAGRTDRESNVRGGRVGGRAQGLRNVVSGQIAMMNASLTPGQRAKVGRIGGLINGRHVIASGQMAKVHAALAAKRATLTPEQRSAIARPGGRAAAVSGQLASIASMGGRAAVASGQLANARAIALANKQALARPATPSV